MEPTGVQQLPLNVLQSSDARGLSTYAIYFPGLFAILII